MQIINVVINAKTGQCIPVHFCKKRVKNFNLRVDRNAVAHASAPLWASKKSILDFLQNRSEWLNLAVNTALKRAACITPAPSKDAAAAMLSPIIQTTFLQFTDILSRMPAIKYKELKSMWGVCYPVKNAITFNTRLAAMPLAAAEYVVMHEFVHFLHPNHGAAFHAEMAKRMPDYKKRKQLLR